MTKSAFQSRVRAIAVTSARTTTKTGSTGSTGTITIAVSFPAAAINELAGQLYTELAAVTPAPANPAAILRLL